MSEITIVNTRPEHFPQLEELQAVCYPTLAPVELMGQEQFASQDRLFPEGQFVALDGDIVVGQGSGFFIDFDFEHPQHTFREICAEFYFTNHDPEGDYYYGADISVHPDWRGRRIGGRLYEARKAVVVRYNRKGIVAGGAIPGYADHKATMTPHEYTRAVADGELRDPTLTFQLSNGFRLRGLIENYLEDSASDNWATLIEWTNPDYKP